MCFALLNNSNYKATESCKARITVVAMPERTSCSSSRLLSLVNAIPRCINVTACFHDTLPTYKEYWTRISRKIKNLSFKVLIFIPAMSRAAANKSFSSCWSPDSEDVSKTNYLLKATD